MPGIKEDMGIKDQVHIILRGPDGKIKDERKPKEKTRKEDRRNVARI